ncbi:replication initiation protein RepC [Poseidonocella sp. HB161398]|uniref:replication initiation protein RepC n=1 Tax=Poseidonocella sp. HB161398 TaxID=2320855 RepID=UPI0011087366|nr:replication initiation protein RepC [Poseidonocella sp. HB161398]
MADFPEPARQRGGPALPTATGTGAGSVPVLNKWRDLLDPIKACAAELKLNGTDIHFLDVLLSFVPGTSLALDRNGQCIVFASNSAIAERMGRSGDSTVNRCIRRTEERGLVQRRMAPNRKRYRRCGAGAETLRAYGIDLSPLIALRPRILEMQNEVQCLALQIRLKRDDCASVLAELRQRIRVQDDPASPQQDQLKHFEKRMRRKLTCSDLAQLDREIRQTIAEMESRSTSSEHELSNTDNQFERHKEHSIKEIPISSNTTTKPQVPDFETAFPTLTKLLEGAHTAQDLDQAFDDAAAMLTDSSRAWADARQKMGTPAASVLLGTVFERHPTIRNPGGYLRHLVKCWDMERLDLANLMLSNMKPQPDCHVNQR